MTLKLQITNNTLTEKYYMINAYIKLIFLKDKEKKQVFRNFLTQIHKKIYLCYTPKMIKIIV